MMNLKLTIIPTHIFLLLLWTIYSRLLNYFIRAYYVKTCALVYLKPIQHIWLKRFLNKSIKRHMSRKLNLLENMLKCYYFLPIESSSKVVKWYVFVFLMWANSNTVVTLFVWLSILHIKSIYVLIFVFNCFSHLPWQTTLPKTCFQQALPIQVNLNLVIYLNVV